MVCIKQYRLFKKLPDEEQQQATRYRHPQRLQSFIASRLLLRRCLSLHENRDLEWRFLRQINVNIR
jgi:phosphopantetheinyl transferase